MAGIKFSDFDQNRAQNPQNYFAGLSPEGMEFVNAIWTKQQMQSMTQVNHSSATPLLMVKNTVYNARLASGMTPCGFTLPLKSSWTAGDWVMMTGLGSAGWTVARGDNDAIIYNGSNAATSVSSNNQFDCAFFYCTDPGQINVTWFTPPNILPSSKGGTGVNNSTYTITLEGNLTTWGPSSEVPANVTLRMNGDTVVTFTQSGNIAPLLSGQSGAQLGDLQLRSASAPLVFSTAGSENAIVVNYVSPAGTGPRNCVIPDIGEDGNFLVTAGKKSVTGSWAGIWADPVSGDLSYVKNGSQVTITFPRVISTATISSALTFTGTLPAEIIPIFPSIKNFPMIIMNADNHTIGKVEIHYSGNITITIDANGNNFTGSGFSGFIETDITYLL